KRTLLLPVSVPSHCSLMKPAAEKLLAHLNTITINAPKISVIHNCDVSPHTDSNEIRQALYQQLFSPVRWIETVQYFENHSIQFALECGPGKVLTGLNKRISPNIQMATIESEENLTKAISEMTVE